jgi:hypothetical protein
MRHLSPVIATVIGALLENARGLVCLAGAVWLYLGIAGVSRPAADIAAGAILLTLGAWPYLRRTYLERARRR